MVKFNGLWCHNSFCNWKFYEGIVLQSFILMKAQLKHIVNLKSAMVWKNRKDQRQCFCLSLEC